MTSDGIEKDSIRSISPIVIEPINRKYFFQLFTCGLCSRNDHHSHLSKGYFQRMEIFKARKRRRLSGKHRAVKGYPISDLDRLSDEQILSIELPESPFLRTDRSISFRRCSFADIEVASSITEQKSPNPAATPRSMLSACSSQTLLRKLLDKAQVLDEYYKDFSHGNSSNRWSSNSLLTKSDRMFVPRLSSTQSNSSRFDLYPDEDNILRELVRFNNDIDLILSRLNTNDSSNNNPTTIDHVHSLPTQTIINLSNVDIPEEIHQTISTMRTETNELDIHSLLANDIDRLREAALRNLLQMKETTETITLNKLNKLPKSLHWKGKHVFGVPLRIYQQTTGHLLPIGILNALEYIRQHAGKCEGLFRKPGVKSKIDQLRNELERNEIISFDQYQPFVVADVIRQYFRELPECLIPPILTRFLPNFLQSLTPDEQLLAVRYTILLLPDETREVLQILLRFLFDVSIRLGNNQTTCRSLARIFLPSVFQSYYLIEQTSSKFLWWKWKKEKFNRIEQENERLVLEQCLMLMIINVDLFDRVPSTLTDELQLPSGKSTTKLDELVRNECNGEFHLKKFISKKTEQFLQRLSTTKFKTVPIHLDDIHVAVHKSSENYLPLWKCSIEIPNTNVRQVQQRLLYERYLWDRHFAEDRTIEKISHDKDILQYVLNSPNFTSIRSFCEFRFSKKVTSSMVDGNALLINSTSIDHLQNHFLPGNVGLTCEMSYYLTPSPNNSAHTIITQLACVDYSGRSSQWYDNFYGSLLAHHLISLRDTFTETTVV